MTATLKLPIIDLSSPDRNSTAKTIRQACIEYGFFYLVNHGVEKELIGKVFDESRKFFSLHVEKKMELDHKEHRGYTAMYAESPDPASSSRGDSKESFYIGPIGDSTNSDLNQWPSKEILPNWRSTVESFYRKAFLSRCWKTASVSNCPVTELGRRFLEKVGGLVKPTAFVRLLHYPGDIGSYGLQICKEKFKQPQVWEDLPHVEGAFIINMGDMMERWTNCLYRSTLHRVLPAGKERYSAALFLNPDPDCVVECLKSCCNESSPPRFPPVRSGDYLGERLKATFAS
ncbi:2-oxoglutarate (2OG) and Fe(II)-dependent oxygenase superfamily protein [Quillaja saponaria]|uniref:2-oxoglutarate (2OG) and Fe(II)-dependent oxygenase superfamily protein n=1 Tax=Quillaja saponaria TaxID=32244 RepID=A0AAD7PEF9_QUISA|nr:2-oxoglutarate (2OG) and Fe(II)-dependent oxygenase superfamily protein [Quillaja saponaria]